MRKLFVSFGCPFAWRSRLTLREKELPYEAVRINLRDKPEDFLRLSPLGKVPLLLDDDVKVVDSGAINEYLEERYPTPPLLPQDLGARGEVRFVVRTVDAEMVGHNAKVAYELFVKPVEERSEERLEEGRRGWLSQVEMWNRFLGERRYLVGDTFTAADLALFTAVKSMPSFVTDIPPHCSALSRWAGVVGTRPAFEQEPHIVFD